MESLNSAARAAGFAMAASDEPYEEVKTELTVETATRRLNTAMLPVASLEPTHKTGDWFRSMFGLFGRRAPASPA